MFYVKQSESTAARRRVPILMVDATDGATPETGLTLYGLVAKNGGTFAASAGTFAETGYGQYYYQFDTGEIDTLGFAGIHVTATGARNYDAIIHVTAYDAYSGSFIAPTDVWNADISAFSSAGTAGSQLNLAALPSGAGITAGDVWEYDISGVTGAGLAGSQVNLAASGGAGITSGDVWSYVIPGPGDPAETVLANINTNVSNLPSGTTIRDYVWNAELSESAGFSTSPPYASGFMYMAGNGATTAAEQVWNYDISAVSGAGLAGTQLNLAALPSGAGITSGDVWSYADRTITGGAVTTVVDPVSVTTASMAGVANTVWESTTASHTTNGTYGKVVLRADASNVVGNVTLRSAGGINMVDADVHRIDNDADAATYLKDGLTGIGASWTGNIVGNVTGSVGSVTADVNVSTASMTGIASTVWNTDISAISTAGSAGTQLNLAALPSGAGITSGDVWTYVDRTITGGIADTVTTVTNTVDISTQSVTDIWSEDVSAYSTPSAGFDLTQAASGGVGITAGDVWEYNISAISTAGTAGSQVNLAALPSGGGITAADVWNYIGTTVTSSTKDTLESAYVQAANAASQTTTSNIRDAVWDEEITAQIGTNTAGGVLYQAAAGTTLNTPVEVWSYATRTLTSSAGATAGDVWSYSDRTITGGSVTSVVDGVTVTTNNDKTGYELSGTQSFNLTGNITGDLSGSVGSVTSDVNVSTTSMTGIASTVWSTDISGYTSPSAGFDLSNASSGSGISAADVWNYSGTTEPATVKETLESANTNASNASSQTGASQIRDAVWDTDLSYLSGSTQAAGILYEAAAGTTQNAPSEVWNYATRTLTSAATGISAFDVWNYTLLSSGVSADSTLGNADDQATNAATNTNSPTLEANIWSYATRTITGGSVTSVVNGVTVTTNNDKTGYSLSGTQSFNLTGNITGSVSGSVGSVVGSVGNVVSPVSVATASMAGIANTVWTAATKTITGGTVDTVTNPVGVSLNSMTGIAGTVWTYSPRTLTSGAGATAFDIWNYNIASITTSGTAGKQLNDAAVSGSVVTVVNGPYVITSIAEGSDGQLDILRNSVQTIQLNLVDGNGSPFNIGGNYAVSVQVFDVSGALAATYTPTVEFAGNGIITFDIDTVVTGTDGRYTLVVSLTDGDVIKLGPLNILVRPL